MATDIENSGFSKEKQRQVQQLIFKSVDATLTQTSSIIKTVEDQINAEYPFIT
jgi:hypothetical protein